MRGYTSTSVAKGSFDKQNIKFKTIFRAEPPIDSGYHFGSRLVIKGNHLYITAGERGQGMIAQDPSKHPGSIIRINLDGSIPKDNQNLKVKNWLPEIFQIGVEILKEWLSLHLTIKFIYLITVPKEETGLALLILEKIMDGKY